MIRACRVMVMLLTIMVGGAGARADDFPSRYLDFIVPFGPNGESDIAVRLMQRFFEVKFNQQLIVKYVAGAGGAVAWSQLNFLARDGYIWMGVNLPNIIIQPLLMSTGYETKDIEVVHFSHFTPDAILVRNDSPYETLADLVAVVREAPESVKFLGSGVGSASYLAHVRFDDILGTETSFTRHSGTALAVNSLIQSQDDAVLWTSSSIAVQKAEFLRPLAFATRERMSAFPNVPTFRELGYEMVSGGYRGVAVPKDTDLAVRRKISQMLTNVGGDGDYRRQMQSAGFEVLDVPIEDVPSFMERIINDTVKVARRAGLID